MADVGAIGKNGRNEYDGYNFRSIDDVYSRLQPALAKNGVFFVPQVLETFEDKYTNQKGTPQVRVKLKVKYTIYGDDGSSIESVVEGEAIDRSDKATNKALTAALKYMLIQVFCIAVEGQDDADKESLEVAPEKTEVKKSSNSNPFFDKRKQEIDQLVSACSKFKVSKNDILKRYKLESVYDLADEEKKELLFIMGQIKNNTKTAKEFFAA